MNETRTRFLKFLARVAEGQINPREWNEFIVAHYGEPELESARGQLSRAAILGGQCSAQPVNAAMQELARELLSEIDPPSLAD